MWNNTVMANCHRDRSSRLNAASQGNVRPIDWAWAVQGRPVTAAFSVTESSSAALSLTRRRAITITPRHACVFIASTQRPYPPAGAGRAADASFDSTCSEPGEREAVGAVESCARSSPP
jgi:hypothetical protein